MKSIMISFILFLSLTHMQAQMDSVRLFPNGAPGVKPNNIKENWYLKGDGIYRINQITDPMLYPFIPENADKHTPAIVICPGGGYGIVSIDSEGFNVARWLQQKGIAAFVLKYRLPRDDAFEDKKIVPLQDVQQAFVYITQHANKYHVDKSKIGVMGFSAGGHLAASSTVLYKYPLVDAKPKTLRPAFSVLVYPVISFTDELAHKGTRSHLIGPAWTDELIQYYSTEKQVDKHTPPALLFHAKDDKTVQWQNSAAYKKACDDNGVKAKVVYYEKGGHGFGVKENSKMNHWLDDLELWLKEMKLIKNG